VALVAAADPAALIAALGRAGAAVQCFEPVLTPEDRAVEQWLGELAEGKFHYVVFFSAQGVRLMCEMARQLGRESSVLAALRRAGLVAQGGRTARALSEFGLEARVRSTGPGIAGLLTALDTIALSGQVVALQPRETGTDAELVLALEHRGAKVRCAGLATEPDASARELVDRLVAQELDELVVFGAAQVKWLWDAAIANGKTGALREALSDVTVIADDTAADALRDRGVRTQTVPSRVLGAPKDEDIETLFVEKPKPDAGSPRTPSRMATSDLELEAGPISSTFG
jgi:uroporphyrinogen-III synthase